MNNYSMDLKYRINGNKFYHLECSVCGVVDLYIKDPRCNILVHHILDHQEIDDLIAMFKKAKEYLDNVNLEV